MTTDKPAGRFFAGLMKITTPLSKISAVFLKEFFALTGTVVAWVFLAMFSLLTGFFTFIVSDILETGQADLTPFFHWMPWLFLFVIPALAMPLWSEERRTGTLELSLSFPVSLLEMVIGKFLAGVSILILALLLTIGTPITIAHLGEPDLNAILCGYVGAFMVGTVFLAVSCFCSALSRSQTASFLFSVLLCGLLLLSGSDEVSNYTAQYLPNWLCIGIEKFSMLPHYQAFQRGLLDTGEIAYALLTTLLFLFFTAASLYFSSSGIGGLFLPGALTDKYTWKQIARLAMGLITALWLYFCLIYTSEVYSRRFDLTADKAYSLSEITGDFVKKLKKTVEIRFYVSKTDGDRFRQLEQYAKRIEWLLRDVAKQSDGKIRLSVIPLEQWSNDEELARKDGLEPLVKQETGERFYLGLTISCGANVVPLNNLIPEREDLLEYEVVRAIRSVTNDKKKRIGILSPLQVLPDKARNNFFIQRFAQELEYDYDLVKLDFNTVKRIPAQIDVLFIFHPANISENALYAIDQYVMNGGKVVAFIDPRLMHNLSASPADREKLISSDLALLTYTWGVRFDNTKTVGDMNYKLIPKALDGEMRVLPRFLNIPASGINSNTPLTAGHISGIHMLHPGALIIQEKKAGIDYTTLVSTSPNAGLFDRNLPDEAVLGMFSSPGADAEYKKDLPETLPLVLHMKGSFSSAFKSPPESSGSTRKAHRSTSGGNPEIVLFADSDMLFRDALVRKELDANKHYREHNNNDNMSLLLNVLEHLSGENNFAQLRTRKKKSRPLTKLQEERAKIEAEYAERITSLAKSNNEYNRQADAVRQKIVRDGNLVRLTDQEKIILEEQIHREDEFKQELQASNRKLKERLKEISNKAKMINIIIIPASVLLFGLLLALLRSMKKSFRKFGKTFMQLLRGEIKLLPACKNFINHLVPEKKKISSQPDDEHRDEVAGKEMSNIFDSVKAFLKTLFRSLRFTVIALLLILVGLGLFLVARHSKEMTGREVLPVKTIEALPEFQIQDIAEIEISYDKISTKLIQENGNWILYAKNKPATFADPATVLKLLEDFSKVKLLRELTIESNNEAAALALASPGSAPPEQTGFRVVLRDKTGKVAREMVLGKLHFSVNDQIGKYRADIPDGRYARIMIKEKPHYFLLSRPMLTCHPDSRRWISQLSCPNMGMPYLIRCVDLANRKTLWKVWWNPKEEKYVLVKPDGKKLDVKEMQKKIAYLTRAPLSRDIASLNTKFTPDSRLDIHYPNGFSFSLEMQDDPYNEWGRLGRLIPSYDQKFTFRMPGETDAEFEKRKKQYLAELEREKKLFGGKIFVLRPELINIFETVPEK